MRSGPIEDWMEFGKHGPEDLEAFRIAAIKRTLSYCEATLTAINATRLVLMVASMLYAIAWIGGAVVVALVVRPDELASSLAAFGGVVSVATAALSAVALHLRRMESELSAMLRLAVRPQRSLRGP
jgi:hypothetical protein